MPVPYQIVPGGSVFRPQIETHINDNTEVNVTYPEAQGGFNSAVMCIFSSPKGRDNKLQTIDSAAAFMREYGLGSFSMYGQPLLNAYNAALAASSNGGLVHCLRVTPDDATYSTATVIAQYRKKTVEGKAVMEVAFVVETSNMKHGTGAAGDPLIIGLTDLEDLDIAYELKEVTATSEDDDDDTPAATDEVTNVKLFTIAYVGRGDYGRNIRFNIVSDPSTDKENDYKNYLITVFRNEDYLEQAETFRITFVEDSIYAGASLYAEDVINTQSNIINISVNYDGFKEIFNFYKTQVMPTTNLTLSTFDVLTGMDKTVRNGAIANYVILPSTDASDNPVTVEIPTVTSYTTNPVTVAGTQSPVVSLGATTGIPLTGGSDGSLGDTVTSTVRQSTLNSLYMKAFTGGIDETISSRNRWPTTLIFDADYPVSIKKAIYDLAVLRTDCMVVLDFGTGIRTKASIMQYWNDGSNAALHDIDDRICVFEPYCMKWQDPYSKKTVTVTSTAWMIGAYISWIGQNQGMHVPMAGNTYGVITGQVADSVYPLFDDSIVTDTNLMDDYAELKFNVAKYNQNQVAVRSMQNTTQSKLSNLTEMNNVLLLLAVKRDCEYIAQRIEFNFAEPENMQYFNALLNNITEKYAGTQLKSIYAHFDHNAWETERSIVHLYVDMIHRDIVKTTIIEIDVNRATES